MRRTARALSVAVLAGAALSVAAPAAFAEPAAEVSPSSVSAGGNVTVSVSCDPVGGHGPDTIDATSQAFEEGTVRLKPASGHDDEKSGPAYSGTARIAPTANFEGGVDAAGKNSAWSVDGTCPAAHGGQGKQWSATFTVSRGSGSGSGSGKPCGTGSHDTSSRDTGSHDTSSRDTGSHDTGSHGDSCATSRPCTESHGKSCATTHPCTESHGDSCDGALVPRGVRAGEGGSFTDSVPALVTGGLLIAGASGAAVYRLRRKKKPADES
ncbi:hypothetical protein ABT063_23785 [Streptomyces sp. NPDC002838]|uniref:hypothetical protein n=1 Tax=Streptomyces sp. NPDC002838 TaxID=3154436 RepID=UPI00332D3637